MQCIYSGSPRGFLKLNVASSIPALLSQGLKKGLEEEEGIGTEIRNKSKERRYQIKHYN